VAAPDPSIKPDLAHPPGFDEDAERKMAWKMVALVLVSLTIAKTIGGVAVVGTLALTVAAIMQLWIPLWRAQSRDLDYDNRDLALLNLGRTALKLDNKERAKAAFEHAYNLNPRMPTLLLELAQINFEEEDYAQAKRYLDRYGDLARQSAQSLLLNIKIERIFGNKDKEASHAMALKNRFPYSKEYLEYKREMSN